jgi:menaquinone-dependent protoporphyrinogen oxidase
MKTMIIYMSNHGCTDRVVHELSEELSGHVTLKNLKEDRNPCFEDYDRVIIGGSIHAGQIQRRVREFSENNTEKLGLKEVGLFICCMMKGEQAQAQLNKAFPEKLHQYAKSEAILGGEYNFDKMRFFERLAVKKIAKVDQSVSNINHDAIKEFADKMDKTFSTFLMLI